MTRSKSPLLTITALNNAHSSTSLITGSEFQIPEANNGATFYCYDAVAGTASIEGYVCGAWLALETASLAVSAATLLEVNFDIVLPERLRVKYTPGSASAGTIVVECRVRETLDEEGKGV